MSRRNNTDKDSGSNIVRLFVWTATIAVVFSIGAIIGQRMLLQDGMPPAVSPPETPALSATTDSSESENADDERSDLYSFYDALTGGEAKKAADDRLDDSGEPADASSPAAETPDIEDVVADDVDEAEDSAPARYTVQIASHPTMERARIEMDRLRTLELDPQLVTDEGPDDEKVYLVRVGKFPTEDEARAFQNRVENNHDLQGLITSL